MKYKFLQKIAPLWRLFWVLVVFSLLVSVFFVKITYEEALNDKIKDLQHLNVLIKEGVESRLFSQESLLRVLSHNFIQKDVLSDPEKGREFLDDMMRHHPNIVAFGLARPDGQLILVSGLKNKQLPNLMENPKTKKSFQESMQSHHMVLGEVYYAEFLHKWVLPLRYSLRDANNNVVLVMILGYDVEAGNALFGHNNVPHNITVSIINKDYYLLDYHVPYARNSDFYRFPLPTKVIKQFDLDAIKTQKLFHKMYIDRNDLKRHIALSFIPKYGVYVSITESNQSVIDKFQPKAMFLILGTLIFLAILFGFFLYVDRKNEKVKRTLEYRASHDSLTGLKNRYSLTQEIQKYLEGDTIFSLAFIDLDAFKKINDFYGHDVGDTVLKQLSRVMAPLLEPGMSLARFSGDEFALLIPGEKEHAVHICEKILKQIKKPFDFEYNAIYLSASIGVVLYPTDAQEIKTLMSYADLALSKAKQVRNTYAFFDQEFHLKVQRKSTIEELFNSALHQKEFYLEYQPQVDANTKKFVGVEALVRWNSASLGMVYPMEFIPIAEENGFIIPLGFFILEEACREMLALHKKTGVAFKLSVNISVRQLMELNFIPQMNQIINKLGFPHDKLIIEVTESMMIEELELIVSKLELLRDLGIGISLDDFGTGYSSLNMINRLPITELKVDQSFVRDILIDEEDALLTELIVGIGKKLKVSIVAEGVETKDHVTMLESYGCDVFQGYFFSKPCSVEVLESYIKNDA